MSKLKIKSARIARLMQTRPIRVRTTTWPTYNKIIFLQVWQSAILWPQLTYKLQLPSLMLSLPIPSHDAFVPLTWHAIATVLNTRMVSLIAQRWCMPSREGYPQHLTKPFVHMIPYFQPAYGTSTSFGQMSIKWGSNELQMKVQWIRYERPLRRMWMWNEYRLRIQWEKSKSAMSNVNSEWMLNGPAVNIEWIYVEENEDEEPIWSIRQ